MTPSEDGGSAQSTPNEELDLTKEPYQPASWKLSALPFDARPYNIDRHRETTRGWIALMLVGLLALVLLGALAGLICGHTEMKDLKELLTIILSPLVALVGAATGFYFGGGGKPGDSKSDTNK